MPDAGREATREVVCPYCGATDRHNPTWMSERAFLRVHWTVCQRLPWWRRWLR